jgi:hypothetical protein
MPQGDVEQRQDEQRPELAALRLVFAGIGMLAICRLGRLPLGIPRGIVRRRRRSAWQWSWRRLLA